MNLAEEERRKRERQEEDFKRRQDAYKRKQEAEAKKREEEMLRAKAGPTGKAGPPLGSRVETEIRMRYSGGTYHFAFFGVNSVNNDAYEFTVLIPSSQYSSMTWNDLKRLPNFTDKFPTVTNGTLLVTPGGGFKAIDDSEKLSTSGIRISSGAISPLASSSCTHRFCAARSAPETTVHTVVWEVGPRTSAPTTFSLSAPAPKPAPVVTSTLSEVSHDHYETFILILTSTSGSRVEPNRA